MRILFLLLVLSVATPAAAQTENDSFQSLQRVLKPGEMVVVTENSGREVTGTVSDLSETSLSIGNRVFRDDAIYAVRRTDPLKNGTVAGVGVGLAATAAFTASCERYRYSEEKGPCKAAAISSGLLWVPIAAVVGRAIDRAHGNEPLYRRRRSSIATMFGPDRVTVHVALAF